ncbi:MAG TPA: beta-ketoacyl-ACP synthase III [Gemmatimonadaceae bacterium]|nr:beta-ketoacyl-ACP synthase III [Gemmatimonadaceae bacterium]
MKRPSAQIVGVGHAVPRRLMTNHDFAKIGIETSDQWIIERTGIRTRYIAGDDETVATMSADASRRAMERAGVTASELDAIVVSTSTPDRLLPAAAVELQAAIGATRAAAFDISAACAGWVYGLTIGEGLLASGSAETVLVVGAEKMSSMINWTDRATCVLFGDGAGAGVLKRSRQGKGILSAYMRSDGQLSNLLQRPKGGSTTPLTPEIVGAREHLVTMAGREVFKHAVRSMADACDRALDGAKLSISDIDLLIPHQANIRIIEATAKHAGMSMDNVYVNVDRYGNTSAASIPIALDEAIQSGRVRDGSNVMFVAFGAGLTWASAIHRF